MKRKAHVVWNGDGENGSGALTTGSGAIVNLPYDFKMRFKNDDGKLGTNPEELVAAAHAGCFNMKLSFVLNENGFSPKSLETKSLLTFVDGVVESIDLSLSAKVPDISDEKFQQCADEAKENCPISGLLNCKISLTSALIQ
tara:strand:- start:3335 stop:3757 length:423 start_codon:yes stop_codon:yes gene_type:complete